MFYVAKLISNNVEVSVGYFKTKKQLLEYINNIIYDEVIFTEDTIIIVKESTIDNNQI